MVAIERTSAIDSTQVRIDEIPEPGQHILTKATEMRPGDVVLKPRALLRPQEFGLLAMVGRTSVKVHPAPRVAIVVTGDELVEPSHRPGLGQIRNSNGPMLLAETCRAGGLPRTLGIARDTPENLRSLIGDGLRTDILVLSGGVSAGKLDLVPGILAELGVEARFHKVEMKPGKPVFFGMRGSTLVFGLPGNPVSSMACFELFVRPAIRRLCGHADVGPRTVQAELLDDYSYRTDRPTYHPAWLEETARRLLRTHRTVVRISRPAGADSSQLVCGVAQRKSRSSKGTASLGYESRVIINLSVRDRFIVSRGDLTQ